MGVIASSFGIGPALQIRTMHYGVGQSVLLMIVVAIGVLSFGLNLWLLVSRTVWKAHDRRQVVLCVVVSYAFVAIFCLMFGLMIERMSRGV
jgi:uncharacterized membrane protein YidH (DUF202 family)